MPRLRNARQEAVAQLKAQAYLDPENAPSDTAIVKKVYGYSQESAESNAVRIMDSDGVTQRLDELIREKMPDSALARKGKQLFEAKKVIVDPKTGRTIAKVPDNAIQSDTWKTLLKMRGLLKDGINVDNRSINLSLSNDNASLLIASIAKLEAMSHKLNGLNELEYNESEDNGGEAVKGDKS